MRGELFSTERRTRSELLGEMCEGEAFLKDGTALTDLLLFLIACRHACSTERHAASQPKDEQILSLQ
jgi:hypothetical protein